MQILIKIIFVLLPIIGGAQISFYKYYSDEGYDFGQGIVQLEDSSYVVTGTSGSFASHGQAFLMHLDSNGTQLWSNHYGGAETDWGRRVLHQENFGFFVCGYSNSYSSSGDFDFYLVKVDESGMEEWSRTYGTSSWEKLNDAALTQDTGTILVGQRNNGAYGNDMYIVRTDSNGDTLWTKTLENMGEDVATSVTIRHDTLVYVGGSQYYADSNQVKGVIYEMHINGQMLDTMIFKNGPGNYELNDLHVLDDRIQGIGAALVDSTVQWTYSFFYADLTVNGIANGSVYNSVTVGADWYGDVFTPYGDSTNCYMAYSLEDGVNVYPGGRDAHVQRGSDLMFFVNGVTWLAMDEPDVNGEIIRTNDGGAILVGYHQNTQVGTGGGTIFLYKIGPDETYSANTPPLATTFVGVEEQTNTIEANIYPNPTQDRLHIELPNNEPTNFTLMDMSGKQIDSRKVISHTEISLGNLSSGMYLLQLSNKQGGALIRVVKR